jgi:hypothetical protein
LVIVKMLPHWFVGKMLSKPSSPQPAEAPQMPDQPRPPLMTASWNGKRPLPWDMFNSFNDAGVGNYTWFFRNWFFSYNYVDLALDGVRSEGGVQTVAVRNPGGMAISFDLVVEYADGSSERVHRTPAVWRVDGRRAEVRLPAGKALKSVSLDTGIFVDANPGDNSWKANADGRP